MAGGAGYDIGSGMGNASIDIAKSQDEKAKQPNYYTPTVGQSDWVNQLLLSSDPSIASGQRVGLERGERVYGQSIDETGSNVQDIVKRRRERLEGLDPASTRMRESRNRQIRMAKASGASPEEIAQISRNAESDIANQEYKKASQSLNEYQKLIGNILKGQTGLELGFAGLEKSGEYVPTPSSGGGLLGTVICTELYIQGYMPYEIYLKDREYGKCIRRDNPHIYTGYIFLASPVVRMMRKSKLVTKIISVPGIAWARNMAGEKNILGSVIGYFGEKVCGIIGRCLYGIQIPKAEA